MGAPMSVIERDIPVRQCQSTKVFKPFPSHRKGSPGDLLVQFMAYPPELGSPMENAGTPYWWVDCQFVPHDSSQLVVSAGAYTLRPPHPWIVCKGVRPGLITNWLLDRDKLAAGVLKGTITLARPNVQCHPDGKYISVVARGCVRVVDKNNNERYLKEGDLRASNFRSCAFSPDGVSLAILYRVQCTFELEVDTMDFSIRLRNQGSVVCHSLCPNFRGNRRYTDMVECKFSPDSQVIALSHSDGMLFTLSKKDLSLHCLVFPGMFNDLRMSNERCYDFDPSTGHEILAAAGNTGFLYFCDINAREVIHEELVHEVDRVDCVQYSSSGEYLALAISDFSINVYSPKARQMVIRLDCKVKILEQVVVQPCTGRYPVTVRMSFDNSGEHLAVSSTDGMVRIWQLPPLFNLQYLCRLKIQQCCGVKHMKNLPLPYKLIAFLQTQS